MIADIAAIVASAFAIAMSAYAIVSVRKALSINPYAPMLGKTVEYKKYEGSDWEVGIVIAVSWHGALQIRDKYDNTFWISKVKARTNVREVRL